VKPKWRQPKPAASPHQVIDASRRAKGCEQIRTPRVNKVW